MSFSKPTEYELELAAKIFHKVEAYAQEYHPGSWFTNSNDPQWVCHEIVQRQDHILCSICLRPGAPGHLLAWYRALHPGAPTNRSILICITNTEQCDFLAAVRSKHDDISGRF